MRFRLQNRCTRLDVAALVVFAALWTYFIVMVRYGFSFADESFYVATAERFVRGDRPLVDDWSSTQLAFLFLCLPYKLYVACTGSTEGVILFLRYVFLAFNAVFFWCMFLPLRKHGLPALIAALLFSVYVPFGIFAWNYYTAGIRLLMLACVILYADRQTPLSLLTAGILFACAVLIQPGWAFLYFGYSALVLARFLREKKHGHFSSDGFGFCVNGRTWRLFSLGVCVCAVVFSAWLLARSGLRDILTSVPYILTANTEYSSMEQGGKWGVLFQKAAAAVKLYGWFCVIFALVIAVLAIVYAAGGFPRRRESARKLLFCFACVIWMWSCLPTFKMIATKTDTLLSFIYASPLFWFGFVCFLLSEQKKTRLLFFWIVGLLSSLITDLLSNSALSLGAPIAYIADLVWIVDLIRELRADAPENKKANTRRPNKQKQKILIRYSAQWLSRLTCICFAIWFGCTILLENTCFLERTTLGSSQFSLPILYEKGPSRSLHCSEIYGKNYMKELADIDQIKSRAPKNLCICGLAPELYVYADLPCAAYATYVRRRGVETDLDRYIRYWKLHPDRLPEVIYCPVDTFDNYIGDDESFFLWLQDTFDPLCEYTLEEGQGGYILYVSDWKPDSALIGT